MRHGIASVREQLWLLGHDDYGDLRPVIDRRALGIGLAAAALVDLLLQGLIEVKHGLICRSSEALDDPGVYRTSEALGLADDPIGSEILSFLGRGPAPRLAEVLRESRAEPFGTTRTPFQRMYRRTRAGLVKAGRLEEEHRRLLPNLYRLTNSTVIPAIRGQFNHRLAMYHKAGADLAMDSLLALVWALNLHSKLPMPYSPSEADPILLAITDQIAGTAGTGSPLTVVPDLAHLVRNTIGDLATAAF